MQVIYKEADIPRLKERTIFFDANILFSLFFTIDPNDWAQINYSRIFSKLKNSENKLVFDVIIVSEVVNRALRMEYKKHLRKYGIKEHDVPYKEFRNSEEGKIAWQKTCEMMCNVILPQFSVVEKSWNKDEIDMILGLQGDFNDLLIANLCKEKNYVLLTNDTDFVEADVDVLSLNSRFLDILPNLK